MIKAMILAAGRGERMRPLTDLCPKPLLKINGTSLIEYHLIALQKAGVREVVINHSWLGKQLENFLGNGQKYGLSINYSPELQALETAGGIIQALPLLVNNNKENKQSFMVINGDIFTDYDYSDLIKKSKQMSVGTAHLVMIENPPHHPEGDFYLSNDLLVAENDNEQQITKYTFSGMGLYHVDFFSAFKPGKRALGALLRGSIASRKVTAELFKGQWIDVGTPQRLAEIDKKLSSIEKTIER